ncbi:transposase [Massilia antarctica]|uniref:Transposase n=1 Tax=Massilia antarctica TaxID=2765360 RepID=A0AA48WF18_9BURK|nr:transposase [Massilia antarctica]QPI51266.1 transposase [Massilia antarctica]
MARLPRLVLPNQPHHIIQHGNDRQLIFRESEDYQRFLGWLKESAREFKVAVHAYVLMPNHLHLLASPSTAEGLAQTMQRVGRYYVPWFNAKYGRSGSLFQGRFKTSLIDAAAYFLLCSRYIEHNPVRNELVSDPVNYPWSSYAHHAGAQPDSLITDHALYWALGNTPFQREAAYIELSRPTLTREQLDQINAAVLKGWPLGSDAFKTELQHRAKRQVLPAKRGRPFKIKAPAP